MVMMSILKGVHPAYRLIGFLLVLGGFIWVTRATTKNEEDLLEDYYRAGLDPKQEYPLDFRLSRGSEASRQCMKRAFDEKDFESLCPNSPEHAYCDVKIRVQLHVDAIHRTIADLERIATACDGEYQRWKLHPRYKDE